ncbi:XK-related protein 8 [Anolis carolinensis]|uniref:XK-related protein 8 n=1 Tax=Anolis carolinensis TaxID=28377 RepID=UPI002F2B3D2A
MACPPRRPPWPPPYRSLDLLWSLAGGAAFLADLGADAWVAVRFWKAGRADWALLVLGLAGLSSLVTQAFSWAWHRGDPPELRRGLPSGPAWLALHVLQLGYLYRCLHALKVGFNVCRTEAATETQRAYAIFLSHDISLLRLFETFLESAPQLTLMLYIILHTNKVAIFQILGICTSFFCIVWTLLDYHQTLRSFLQEKYKLDFLSSVLYFLWNFLLVCPRILSLAVFAVLFPNYIFLHFLGVWSVMFLWVSLQGTDFMENTCEWVYRAVVAVILYFCWFNVAAGKTCHRAGIYHTFILLDSIILSVSWLWHNTPLSRDSYIIHALFAALPCYLLGIILRGIYYKFFHPTVQTVSPNIYDEVDTQETVSDRTIGFQVVVDHRISTSVMRHVNRRTYKLSQNFFVNTLQDKHPLQNGTLGDVYL